MKTKSRKRRMKAKKYSEFFLEFAGPLLELSDNHELICEGLQLVQLAWNTAWLDHRDGTTLSHEVLSTIRSKPGSEPMAILMDILLARRIEEFGEHDWLAGEVTVRAEGDELIVRVEARAGRLPKGR
jgi:hypothetical protein